MKIPKPSDVLVSAMQEKNLHAIFANIPMTDTEADIDNRTREQLRNDIAVIMDSIYVQMGDAEQLLLEYYQAEQHDQLCCSVLLGEQEQMPMIYLLHLCNIAAQLLSNVGWDCEVVSDLEQRSVQLNLYWNQEILEDFYKKMAQEII